MPTPRSLLLPLSLLFALVAPTPARAQQTSTTVSVTVTSAPSAPYVALPVPDDEAVTVSLTATGIITNPLVTAVGPFGEEADCILPCTVRSRVGVTRFEGARLAVDVELAAAGVTYDVQLTPGPTGDDFGIVTAMVLVGALSLGFGAWGLTQTNDEDLTTLAAIGTVYGGLSVGIGVPWLIVLLATIDGTASITGYRRGLAMTESGPAFTF